MNFYTFVSVVFWLHTSHSTTIYLLPKGVKLQDDFDIDRFTGLWYEIGTNAPSYKLTSDVTFQFKLQNQSESIVETTLKFWKPCQDRRRSEIWPRWEERRFLLDFDAENGNSTAKLIKENDEPGWMPFGATNYRQGLLIANQYYSILYTDYENIAVIVSERFMMLSRHSLQGWILARRPSLSQAEVDSIFKIITERFQSAPTGSDHLQRNRFKQTPSGIAGKSWGHFLCRLDLSK